MKNKKNVIEFIIKIIKGMIVGIGSISAGAGTFAIVLGIYDRCMEILAKPFKNFKENFRYILPIIIGIIISERNGHSDVCLGIFWYNFRRDSFITKSC